VAQADVALGKETRKDVAALLRESQARWAQYRDAKCKLHQTRSAAGSATAMSGFVCGWRLAAARTEEVRADQVVVGGRGRDRCRT
jgi:uncharacterized protein YecT (DUF1311 family)